MMKPATLGSMARAGLELTISCSSVECGHRGKFSPAEVAAFADQHGAETILVEWAQRLRCSACGGRKIGLTVSAPTRNAAPVFGHPPDRE
jgi:hypothetical protein